MLAVNILGKPSSCCDAIAKPAGTQPKVSATATPKNSKVTDHMVRFLASLFGVAMTDIGVVFEQTSIHKQLRITAPKQLPAVLTPSRAGTLPAPAAPTPHTLAPLC